MGDDDRRRRRSDEDLISGLPDEPLHGILARLRSARAAARTGVLSRRWRRVWPHVPEIHLDVILEAVAPPAASFPDAVDGALAGCLAPSLERFSVTTSADLELLVPAACVERWLRFAAGRVAGELLLSLPVRRPPRVHVEEAVLNLPVCGGAKKITLILEVAWRLRLPPAGSFSALTELIISCVTMDGGELSNFLCTQCPHLSKLSLFVEQLVAVTDITILSDSLRFLLLRSTNTHRLEVIAPELEELMLHQSDQVHISAPKLAKLEWNRGAYDGRKHLFHDVGRCIRELVIGIDSAAASVMRRFDEVDVLSIRLSIPQGKAGYRRFSNGMKKLIKCKTLSVSLIQNQHRFVPAILHLLRSRSCNSTRKFSLVMPHSPNGSSNDTCPSSCPCCSEGSRRIDGIDLGSLDEVEINSIKGFHEEFEFVELLSKCNARVLKKLVINFLKPGTLDTKEVCEKVRSMCQPNVEVEFYVFPDGPFGQRVRLD